MPYRTLIVEDEAVVLSFAETVLRTRGHEVITARSVAEARRIFAAQPAGVKLCLVVDVVLDDESGIAFAQECITRDPEHRVLLMSGFTDEVLMSLPEQARPIAFLKKPFSQAELLTAYDSLCGS